MRFLLRLIGTSLAVALTAWLLPGISVGGSSLGAKIFTLAVVAALIGVVNSVVKPLFTALTGCLVVITMGLFLLVINAVMLLLVGWLAGKLGLPFEVNGFWTALFGSVMISLVSGVLHSFLRSDEERA